MKVTDLENLWVARNAEANFTMLICALDEQEAIEAAEQYRCDTNMSGNFQAEEFKDEATRFDCDYVVVAN